MKQRIAMKAWARSATGISIRLPGRFTHRVVALHVRLLGGDVHPTVGELPDTAPVGLDHRLGVQWRAGLTVHELRGVSGLEQVGAFVIGEEDLGRVKAGRRGERSTARRTE
jgi:hypothetical protein